MKKTTTSTSRLFICALALTTFAACEDAVLAPASGFVPSECPPDEPNCDQATRIDSGIGTLPSGDTGPVTVDTDSGDPNGGGPDSGVLDSGDPNAPDSGVDPGLPDSGIHPDAGGPPPPPPEFLNLAGTHDTEYELDLSDYLFGINNLAGPLDFINRAFQGRLVSGPLGFIVNPIIQNIANQFVPPWVMTLIDVLSQVANFFEAIDVNAVLNIQQDLPMGQTSALHGSETWTRLRVRLINQCMFGRMDPNYPACAQRDIAIVPAGRTNVGPLEVEVDVRRFDGVLQPGRPEADFVFTNRSVSMDMYKLLTIMIDLALRLATNGQITSLSQGLMQLIDCQALATGVLNATNGNQAAYLAVLTTCVTERDDAIDAITDGLNGVPLGLVDFDFDQRGHAVDTNGNHRPEILQTMATPDTIDGDFSVIIGSDLGGRWGGRNRSP